eukprot:6187868-Pleurochrysis_carterae.AAC.7
MGLVKARMCMPAYQGLLAFGLEEIANAPFSVKECAYSRACASSALLLFSTIRTCACAELLNNYARVCMRSLRLSACAHVRAARVYMCAAR